MSEMAKTAREAMKAKAARLGGAPGPGEGGDVDASGWREPVADMNAQTGMRPVSKRQFKRGGKVEGEKAHHRADRKPRKSGGRVADFVNRDVRDSNHEIAQAHVGGFRHGGATNFRKQMHADVAEDKRLIKHMVKKDAIRTAKRNGGGQWIAGAIQHPGALHEELHVPKGEKIPAKKLNKAAHSDNPKLAKRANLAKTLGRMHKADGGLAEATGMRPKGDRIARKHGGKTKGKTNIAIIVNPHGAQQQQAQMPPPAAPVRPPMPAAVPGAPPQGMPPGMQGPPPATGAGMAPGMPMPRKSGGGVYSDVTIAAAKRSKKATDKTSGGGGAGTLSKTAIAKATYGAKPAGAQPPSMEWPPK